MRIVVDIQGIQNRSKDRGIGRYVLSLARALARNAGSHDILFLYNVAFGDDPDDLLAKLGGAVGPQHLLRFEPVAGAMEPHDGLRGALRLSEALYRDLIRKIAPDVLLVGSFVEGWEDHTITVTPARLDRHLTAGILYDLIPLMNVEKYLGYRPTYDWYFRRLAQLEQADVLLSISESARQEGLSFLGRETASIVNISTAASEEFEHRAGSGVPDPAGTEPTLSEFGITRPFLMHTSAFDERKNFQGLVRAFAALPVALRKAHQLVLVCKIDKPGRGAMQALVRELGLDPDEVILTGFVSDDQLVDLYSAAKLFVFPSFHEGFGLPILEAMHCGTPAIGSNVSSIPEVIGREDFLFDPESTKDMASLIERALTDDVFYTDLLDHAARQRTFFNWDDIARKALATLEKRVAERDRPAGAASQSLDQDVRYPARMHELQPDDLRALAIAFARNESESARVQALAAWTTRLSWRIEGPFDSSYSLALLNRETARALAELGHEPILHSTEGPGDFPANPFFLDANPDLAEMHAREPLRTAGAVDVVSRNLYPPRVNDMRGKVNALHHYGWEESGFPARWVDDFNTHLDFMTVMSDHCRKVMIDNGVVVPITTSGVGVDHWTRIAPSANYRLDARTFRFLHVSSCFPRKGVEALLDAFEQAFTSDDDVSLVIKTFPNPHNSVVEQIAECRARNPRFPHVVVIMDDLSDEDLKALYQQCHVMVLPSKAEGFCLPLAEAMLSGIPAITTNWSGQLDFCNESNCWLVDYRFAATETHFNLWSSAWAEVVPEALARAMRDAFHVPAEQRREMAANGAAQLLADHKWTDVVARMIGAFRDVQGGKRVDRPTVGWVTTWNTRCGIATYSEHLIHHLPLDVVVLANQDRSTISDDQDNVTRCWQLSKHFGGLSGILAEVRARQLSTVVIQFNYSFFNHEELAQLLRDFDGAGVAVLLMLHSTDDPVLELPGNELHRIRDELALADRLLVHSIGDLNRLKAIGLIENVTLFPHGVLNVPPEQIATEPHDDFVVATYGFALPNKGLGEVLQAVAAIREGGQRVRLRMINAEYPVDISRAVIEGLRREADRLDMLEHVEFHHDFLSDEDSLELLRGSDLIVFAYQETKESASGAVRYGLSAGRPVAVTPLSIFDDLGDAAYRFSGTSVTALTAGITRVMKALNDDSAEARIVEEKATSWRDQHDYARLGQRLANIATVMTRDRKAIRLSA